VDWNGKPLFQGHQTATLNIRWTVEETEVSRLLTEYILKSIEYSRGSDRGTQLVVQLVMHTFHKIAASSWTALRRALNRRLDALDGKAQKLNELLAEIAEDADDDADKANFVLPAKMFFDDERQLLECLLKRLDSLPVDSKWNQCAKLLQQLDQSDPGAKVLIFTQYRVTQDQLQERLAGLFPHTKVEIINGDVEMRERQQTRVRFENASRFLVSTEAGGEGVNLQRACHLMINYDLPWNPMRIQQRIGRLDRYGQKQVVKVFNLMVPDSWDHQISIRIMERLQVIQKTMALAGPGELEDYQEMILGEIAEQIDATRMFAESQSGQQISDAEVDEKIQTAIESMKRWRELFSKDLGLGNDTTHLRLTLTSEHFKAAYRFACEHQGIRLRESRNSQNQFLPEVFNFDLPAAFRDPVFRPSRSVHVVFDREVYSNVRGQDLGTVRGQTIRPLLTGFGEPFADWLFQTAMHPAVGESAFSLQAPEAWAHGPGWLFVYALRWLGKRRRLLAADSLAVCFLKESGEVLQLSAAESMTIAIQAKMAPANNDLPGEEGQGAVKRVAQQALKTCAMNRDAFAKSAANLSLLMVASVKAT
jgi:hypothetical protein